MVYIFKFYLKSELEDSISSLSSAKFSKKASQRRASMKEVNVLIEKYKFEFKCLMKL